MDTMNSSPVAGQTCNQHWYNSRPVVGRAQHGSCDTVYNILDEVVDGRVFILGQHLPGMLYSQQLLPRFIALGLL